MVDKREILTAALAARCDEVDQYQIDIDNYERAIVKASEDDELADFTAQLEHLLATSRLEQKKAAIMRDVIREQLGE